MPPHQYTRLLDDSLRRLQASLDEPGMLSQTLRHPLAFSSDRRHGSRKSLHGISKVTLSVLDQLHRNVVPPPQDLLTSTMERRPSRFNPCGVRKQAFGYRLHLCTNKG